ncbi:Monooxygenase FAD-binding protein OS=Tsukamurella paurometabola (strain ATCC 8368 / DSM / CCUG 35730 / CIP 100753 / JCM 10117 / KCTC 9821 / NBRC 16120 /NCIMB 702349 / NCTC 13040) OX=521096 GN=Tpau_2424 PE=4 SV=1 [Tsukamurella paurometabola]|uniref:Monooxygenase FAD-binding protein n=1 Tax=Tsukamurella paurometabola (strain ATCC 8368 / DSM 20162 / CCUG 35730 / CIP 100753 / JCM 10117 / KCTC 9821 / NBRC 16120 / NCIMB 702349 / NCTC 13040) TaxID=521096 RepID=D5UR41_TSUPD|nr:monooxygenase FAD-binding protein [Tsukamurella paurometabola DSM 20162]SUP33824.1 6-hydroxynicotinate 3-monooxygenase precursor [Tsukamurella paurometabola]
MNHPRVLIAGASIAGPALAHWLSRRGATVTVVERAPALRPGGQAVDARGVAKEVIARMGLDAQVRAACTDTAGAYVVDEAGTVLETFRAEDDDGDGFIAEIEILRGDLSQVLYDATRDAVDYRFGDRITELTQDANGVDVTFTSGTRERYDLVIGADGLHSSLRALVFGPHERYVRHLGHALAFYTVPNEFGLDRWLITCEARGRTAGLRPIRDATLGMALFSFSAPEFTLDHRDIAAQKRVLRERMAGLGWLTPRILAHLDDAPDFYLDQVAQVVMDRWSAGRVGLIGDAASCSSPMSGQGTGIALVGAYVLAGELAAAHWDPDAGFAAYERLMRPFVAANQEIAQLNARGRDAVAAGEAAPQDWDFALIERAINGIDLPDYDGVADSGPLS